MTMRFFGGTADLATVVQERRNDVATVNGKLTGRNVTGARLVPTSNDDILTDDRPGDVLFDLANNHKYECVLDSGVRAWVRTTITTSF